jgi:hypothetical protein
MAQMLHGANGFVTFCECLYNGAPFDQEVIAREILEKSKKAMRPADLKRGKHRIIAALKDDFFSFASRAFLRMLVQFGSDQNPQIGMVVALYALSELARRKEKVSRSQLGRFLQKEFSEDPELLIEVSRRDRRSGNETEAVQYRLSDVVLH